MGIGDLGTLGPYLPSYTQIPIQSPISIFFIINFFFFGKKIFKMEAKFSFIFCFLNNFWEAKEMRILLLFPIILDHFLPWNTRIIPVPFFPFVCQGPKNGQKIPFILKKWSQVRGVRTRVPQISGAALLGRPKWWKNIILVPIVIFILFEENRKEKCHFQEKCLFS